MTEAFTITPPPVQLHSRRTTVARLAPSDAANAVAAAVSAFPDLSSLGLPSLPALPVIIPSSLASLGVPTSLATLGDALTAARLDLDAVPWLNADQESSAAVGGAAALVLAALAGEDRLAAPRPASMVGGQRAEAPYEGVPYAGVRGSYDHVKAAAFFAERPGAVLRRASAVWGITNELALGLLFDWKTGQLEKNEAKRAVGIRDILVALGPTFVKLGQALSIRPDLIPAAYADELASLQDEVPPFNSEQARDIMAKEYGVSPARLVPDVFATLSPDPVAAASIGQVFRGTTKDGVDVAVKVQRPDAHPLIALDLHLLRLAAPLQAAILKQDVDLELIDEWGSGFVNELDYRAEAEATAAFAAAMEERGLDAVSSPTVVEPLSTPKVLVTEWVDGTRLDQSDAADVPRLCGVALNAFLTMLLDTGTLHCDPHPGNLLRTRDGRLIILDWGMTQRVQPEIQYALIEYIAHITAEDYEAIPRDFVNMGFLTSAKEQEVRESGFLEPLTYMLKQLAEGGGPSKVRDRILAEARSQYPGLDDKELAKVMQKDMQRIVLEKRGDIATGDEIDVADVTKKFEQMARDNADNFKLPPYFLYLARAFATLEGLGLSVDEDFSIVAACFPFLAKRLLTDDSPRAEAALRSLLYSSAASAEGGAKGIDPEQLKDVLAGFTEYTESTASVGADDGRKAAVKEAADLLLAPNGSLIQTVLVDELANVFSAVSKAQVNGVLQRVAETGGLAGLPLAPARALANAAMPFTKPTPTDDAALALGRSLAAGVSGAAAAAQGGGDSEAGMKVPSLGEARAGLDAVAANLPPVAPLLPGAGVFTGRLFGALLRKTAGDIEHAQAQATEHGEGGADGAAALAGGVASGLRRVDEALTGALPERVRAKSKQ